MYVCMYACDFIFKHIQICISKSRLYHVFESLLSISWRPCVLLCRIRCRSGGRRRRTAPCLASRYAGNPSCRRPQTWQSPLQPSASPSTTRWRCAGWRPPPWSVWSPTCWTLSTGSPTLFVSSSPPTGPSPPPAPSSSCCFRGERHCPHWGTADLSWTETCVNENHEGSDSWSGSKSLDITVAVQLIEESMRSGYPDGNPVGIRWEVWYRQYSDVQNWSH